MAGLIVITRASAYLLWSLLLRAEQRYAQLESHGQTAADIAGHRECDRHTYEDWT